jgi:hypothetical protein
MAQYGAAAFWDARYAADSNPYDWYTRYSALRPVLEEAGVRRDQPLLVLGCGTSRLSGDLAEDGYASVTSCDISAVAVDAMRERARGQGACRLELAVLGQAQGGVDDHGFGLLAFDQHATARLWRWRAFNFGGGFLIGHGASKKNDRSILHQFHGKKPCTCSNQGKSGAFSDGFCKRQAAIRSGAGGWPDRVFQRQVPCQFKLHANHVDEHGHRGSARFDHKVSRFTVKRVTRLEQGAQSAERIVHLEQRTGVVMAHASEHIFRRGSQVNHLAAFVQVTSIGLTQYGPTTRGYHALMRLGQLVNHLLLQIPETDLTLTRKKLTDRAAQAVLDHMVRVDKGQAQTTRQLASNGSFAGAWKAHKNDAQVQSLAEIIGLIPQVGVGGSRSASVFEVVWCPGLNSGMNRHTWIGGHLRA